VAVEFGLIAPLLILLVMGIIDFGYMIHKSTLINNVARDGARVASLDGSYSDITSLMTSELSNVGIAYPSNPASDLTISITCQTGASPPVPLCTNSQSSYDTNIVSGATVVVTVSYNYHWITPVGALCKFFGSNCVGNSINLVRTAEMVRE
jgi:Flp pilus assembly protein TadG